jgi:hypothetical protein
MPSVTMANKLRVVEVRKDDTDGILVAFSDGTVTGYVVEELIELRPFRETGTCERRTLRAVQHPRSIVPHVPGQQVSRSHLHIVPLKRAQ